MMVTGCSKGGIGYELCKAFAAAGCRVSGECPAPACFRRHQPCTAHTHMPETLRTKHAHTLSCNGGASSGPSPTLQTRMGFHLHRPLQVFATARTVAKMAGLEALGCTLVQLDVLDAKSCERAVQEVVSAAGRIDVLCNNAGVYTPGEGGRAREGRHACAQPPLLAACTVAAAAGSAVIRGAGDDVMVGT